MDKTAYQQKMESIIEGWNAKLDALKAQAKGKNADARLSFDRRIRDIEYQKNSLGLQLEKLKAANDATWADFKYEIDSAIINMKKTFNSVRGKF
jgi:hypothetical protein